MGEFYLMGITASRNDCLEPRAAALAENRVPIVTAMIPIAIGQFIFLEMGLFSTEKSASQTEGQ